jgi:hypothetical protein
MTGLTAQNKVIEKVGSWAEAGLQFGMITTSVETVETVEIDEFISKRDELRLPTGKVGLG